MNLSGEMSGGDSRVPPTPSAPDPGLATDPPDETDLVDPFAVLKQHPDLSLCVTRLPDGERGRWYPDLHVIVLDDRLTQAERRVTLLHELVHRMRGDTHIDDDLMLNRRERSCHHTVAQMLIPFATLRAAMSYGREPHELAEELWVDVETLQARIMGLSAVESAALLDDIRRDEVVA